MTWTFDAGNKPPKSTRIAFDLETFLIAPCVQAPNVVAMGFQVDGGKVQIVAANDPAFDGVVEALFNDHNAVLFAHNARFDIIALLAHGARFGLSHWPAMIFGALQRDSVTCTHIRETLLHIALADPTDTHRKFDLGACAERRDLPTKPDKSDPYRMKWGELAGLPVSQYPAEATKYLVEDVQACAELFSAQGRKPEWLVDQFRQTRAAVALGLISAWGFATNQETVEELARETKADLEAAQAVCKEHGLVRPDGSRDLKAAQARIVDVYTAAGKEPPRGEPTAKMAVYGKPGNIVTDDAACSESGDYVLQMYARASQSQSLLAKVERLRHPVIQPSFTTLLETGRTGCTQGKDPKVGEAPTSYGSQLQNPSRSVMHLCRECVGVGCPACKGKGEVEARVGLRECFVARRKRLLLDIDYRMAELCALGEIERMWFGSSTLGDILNDPKRDAHVELAAMVRGMSVEEAFALKRTDPKAFKTLRQSGKALSFGAPGGLGAARLVDYAKASYDVELTESQAKEYLAAIKRIYPERRAYLDRIGAWAQSGRFRFTQPYSGRVRGGLNYTNGANTGFQGLAADFAKEGMWRVAVHCYVLEDSPLYGSRIVNMVHDQLLVETPEATYRQAAKTLEEQWVGAANEICPGNRMIAEPAACRRWSKQGGDAVYDSAGQLAIYEDTLGE